MYTDIGSGRFITDRELIGIFDLDITSQSHLTRKYLAVAQSRGEVINAAEDIPKSFIVCASKNGAAVYLSQMSTATLKSRAENGLL